MRACRHIVVAGNPYGAGPSVSLMVFEKFIRSAGLAVGLKPSATECEARLRGLERIMYSKTINDVVVTSTQARPSWEVKRSPSLRRARRRLPGGDELPIAVRTERHSIRLFALFP